MALEDKLIKINLKDADCTGLYYKNNQNIFDDTNIIIDDTNSKKIITKTIDIVIKLNYKRKIKKLTLTSRCLSFKRAVQAAIAKRYELFQTLNDAQFFHISKTFDTVWQEYIAIKIKIFSESHIYSMIKIYNKHIQPKIGAKKIDQIGTKDLQAIVDTMLTDNYAPRSCEHVKNYTSPVFKFAIKQKYTDTNPALNIELQPYDNKMYLEIEDEQLKKLYFEIDNYEIAQYRAILMFALFGRRLNEILSLEWQDISFEKKIYRLKFKNVKVRKNFTFPLHSKLEEVLLSLEYKRTGLIFRGIKTDKKLDNSVVRNHWEKILKRANIPKLRIHDTRHCIGYTMINDGYTLESIGRTLGHLSSETTKRYSNISLKTAENVTNNYINKLQGK